MAIDIEHFKQKLEGEKTQLIKELESIGVRNPSFAEDWVPKADEMSVDQSDPNEASDKKESYVSNLGINAPLETRYNNVKDALERIEAGTYGTCNVCGKEIDTERLEANPAATTCREHMDNEEQ